MPMAAMHYTSTNIGTDTSSNFPLEQGHTDTQSQIQLITLPTPQTDAGICYYH